MSFATSAPSLAKAVTATFATYCTADFLSNFLQVRGASASDDLLVMHQSVCDDARYMSFDGGQS